MGSNFFTNEEENTLKNRINSALKKDKNIKYLDFLIGYFRITGFDKISDNLSYIKKTRILVGINADKSVYDASQLIKKFAEEQIEIYNEEPIDLKEYQNFKSMINLIVAKKIEVRISADKNVHSKMYLMRDEGEVDHEGKETEYQGRVIIGSSNLTHNGLEANTEINAELKDDKSLKDAVKVFENLWSESVELTEDDFDKFIIPKLKEPSEKQEITKENITPYQVYIKTLQVYFNERIDFIDFNSNDMPKEFRTFNYQSDAVQDGISKLNKYNGFYLADVVGLGKTIIAILIIKRLKVDTLVIAPNSVLNQWRKAIKDFKIENIECVSKDSIPDATNAELIVIDEAHNFRNSDTNRYVKLEQVCKHPYQKKIMLLSATPQNNEPNDIANQIYLFQNQNASTIPNLLKLKTFFDGKNKAYQDIIKNPSNNDKKALDDISQDIKSSVLKYIMTRRTRSDIESCEMYKSDVDSFPKLAQLTPLQYELKEKDLIKKYNETAEYLQVKLQYARFKSLNKLNQNGRAKYKSIHPHISDNIFDENPLAKLMQIQLVKRFESSFEAFKISLNRHTRRLDKFIQLFKEEDIIYLGDRSNEFLDDDKNKFKIVGDKIEYDVLTRFGKYKESRQLKGNIFRKEDFEKDFLDLLGKDLERFEALNEQWKYEERDPKIEIFKKELQTYKDKKEKVVVFTESQDTGRYLAKNLISKVLYIDSNNRDENIELIAQNFDANIDKKEQRDDYNIIITTDTLAEGINLHRSHIIYNYDIPWNATKLMQRIGRINRIGSQADSYSVFNFKPVAKSEEIIGLSHKAHTKLQSFHSTYGEDNKIYTDAENVESKELFEIMKLEKEEIDDELMFLQEVRTFKDNYPEEYQEIEKLSNDIQISLKNISMNYLYKKGTKTHRFYSLDAKVNEIDFVTFATSLKSYSNDMSIKGDDKFIENIQSKVDDYHQVNVIDKIEMQENDTQNSANNGKAIGILKIYARNKTITKEQYQLVRKQVEDGVYNNLSKEIINSTSENILAILSNKKIATKKTIITDKEEMQFVVTCVKGL
ncbi:MAG: helicase domain protein [uncultured Sulfurovum sp.]|uniref:Helicase domain protein n=1 Tax=uncultured Sulfurovum sp. TaxID=269237 RepID=A0A6S6S6P1_9BACT|nr:MAG: helicase domain protein [uncultured Sulfurovum sp.]